MMLLFQIIARFLQMGFIALFLSEALISGYTCAASFAIFNTQISFLLGLDRMAAAVDPGPFYTPRVSITTKYMWLNFSVLFYCRNLLDPWNCYSKEKLMLELLLHLFFVLSSSLQWIM